MVGSASLPAITGFDCLLSGSREEPGNEDESGNIARIIFYVKVEFAYEIIYAHI